MNIRRLVTWLNTGDNSMITCGVILLPLAVVVMIGLVGAP